LWQKPEKEAFTCWTINNQEEGGSTRSETIVHDLREGRRVPTRGKKSENTSIFQSRGSSFKRTEDADAVNFMLSTWRGERGQSPIGEGRGGQTGATVGLKTNTIARGGDREGAAVLASRLKLPTQRVRGDEILKERSRSRLKRDPLKKSNRASGTTNGLNRVQWKAKKSSREKKEKGLFPRNVQVQSNFRTMPYRKKDSTIYKEGGRHGKDSYPLGDFPREKSDLLREKARWRLRKGGAQESRPRKGSDEVSVQANILHSNTGNILRKEGRVLDHRAVSSNAGNRL